jgi:hypothetical protein
MILEELLEKLKQVEEVTLLDRLGVSSEELVEKFSELIEEDPEHYLSLLDYEEDEGEDVDG